MVINIMVFVGILQFHATNKFLCFFFQLNFIPSDFTNLHTYIHVHMYRVLVVQWLRYLP